MLSPQHGHRPSVCPRDPLGHTDLSPALQAGPLPPKTSGHSGCTLLTLLSCPAHLSTLPGVTSFSPLAPALAVLPCPAFLTSPFSLCSPF